MPATILATKLYIPRPRSKIVLRPGLLERLNEGLTSGHILTLISASAGFGKTTLVSEWIGNCGRPAVWLSLDESDNDPLRFISYLAAGLQTIKAGLGAALLASLQTSGPQSPPTESILTSLINEIIPITGDFILVLDDYHVIDAKAVDDALTFLIEHLPPQMHLVITTREDPQLPLSRLRVRNQLTELRAADLRFTPAEAADFLNQVMGLNLPADDITALEARTEGWIAGLQLAALSMQGQQDTTGFIRSFTGGHHFVLDYLIEEVLQQQPESVQTFLLRTSILDRMCASLCDAVLLNASGQETLETLERANLFIVPLDNERHWYRYHHLFGDLLRQRLGQSLTPGAIAADHIRASEWHEVNGLMFEAFRHAAAANDVGRAGRLIGSRDMPLHLSGVVMAVLDWLASLPDPVLDASPWLRVKSATLSLMAGQTTGVEDKLQAAEKALQHVEQDAGTRDLIGQVACARATLALTRYDTETMLAQARRALEYLHPDDLPFRFTANWALATASIFNGDRVTAARASKEGISISQKSGDVFSTILATTNLGRVQEMENQFHLAAETYRSVLPLFGDHPQPNASEAYLGLANIHYEWNDLETAQKYGEQSLQLARQFDRVIDRFIVSEVFLSRLKLARGDVDGAAALLARAEESAHRKNFLLRLPEIASAQVLVLLRQGSIDAADQLTQTYELSLSRVRVLLARGDPSAALALLEPLHGQMQARGWQDELLKVMVVQAVALHLHREEDAAVQLLANALALAEPGGFIRTFIDEELPMAKLLIEVASRGVKPDYTARLLAAFETKAGTSAGKPDLLPAQPGLIDPLSLRELEILRLIAQGLSNREIGERLFLALDTIKGYNRRIFDKLQVQSRTEAIARARELGVL
jgi:LuxR family maltose regulon positive regulatory protein